MRGARIETGKFAAGAKSQADVFDQTSSSKWGLLCGACCSGFLWHSPFLDSAIWKRRWGSDIMLPLRVQTKKLNPVHRSGGLTGKLEAKSMEKGV
jgi:hypothetical protein